MKTSVALKTDKPKGLSFRTPQSALDRWDPSLVSAKAAPPEEGEISLLAEIGPEWMGGVSAGMIDAALKAIGSTAPVRVVLNSPGGDAFEGIAIYNLLAAHPANVTVQVIGMAASAASIVAMAGDRIEMGEAASMMIHSAWGLVVGNAADMTDFSSFLNMIDTSVAELYANRSGQSFEDVLAMMKAETWMNGKDAVDKGFADVAIAKDSKKKGSKALAAMKESIFSRSKNSAALLAAFGEQQFSVRMSAQPSPGVPANKSKAVTLKGNQAMKPTISKQIAEFEAKHTANLARMDVLIDGAAEAGRSLEEAESQEYDGLKSENGQVMQHITRLKDHEKQAIQNAKPVPPAPGNDREQMVDLGRGPVISVKPNVEPGIAWTRYCKALAQARGNNGEALMIAQHNQRWKDQTPQVERALMANVVGGDTTTAGWASELVYNQNLVSEFMEFLRPQTIIGRIPNLTRVPFNVRMAGQSSGSTAYWVGQGKPVPVSKLGTNEVTLGIAKAAGLVVLTEELVRSSEPSAELLVRNDLTRAIVAFTDAQFVDPAVAVSANVSPASITNLVEPTVASGTAAANLRTDLQTLMSGILTNNYDPSGVVLIMTPLTAMTISLMLTSLGNPMFPGMSMFGGTLLGIPVITSMAAIPAGSPVAGEGRMIILALAPEILLADDGGLTVDASREASLQMLDNPTNDVTTPTATSLVSMFQTNSVAIKITRFINWKKRRASVVSYIKDAAYV